MAGKESFDMTCGCDLQEVDNAVNMAMKEIRQRFDFKGLKVGIDFLRSENRLVLRAPDDFKLKAAWEVLEQKLVRRHVAIKNLQMGKVMPAAGSSVTQEISLQQGIPGEKARAVVKYIKDRKLKKVQCEIQGDQVRVSSPSRDELQNVIALIRTQDFGLELRFGNYRSL